MKIKSSFWVLLIALVSPCGAQEITIVLGDGPPYINEMDGKIQAERPGFSVELVSAAFRVHGISIDYKIKPFLRQISTVRNGSAHAMMGLVESDAPDFIFPKHVIGIARDCFYAKRSSQWKYASPSSLNNVHLLTVDGYSYGEIDEYVSASDSAKVTKLKGEDGSTIARMVKLVSVGRADVFVESDLVTQKFLNEIGDSSLVEVGCLSKREVRIGFSPSLPISNYLIDKFDSGMTIVRKTGEFSQILKKYSVNEDF